MNRNIFTCPLVLYNNMTSVASSLQNMVIFVLTALSTLIPISSCRTTVSLQMVWNMIIINIALSHCSALLHGFLCISINVTPVGRMHPFSKLIHRLLDFHLQDNYGSVQICLFQCLVKVLTSPCPYCFFSVFLHFFFFTT